MDDGRIGHAELRDRRRRALPGRRVSRARTESACTASDFGEPDAACGRHRCYAGTGPRTRRPGAAGAVRELRRPQRHDHRPVRAPLDAQRTGHRRRGAHPARRRRLRLGVDAGRRSRRRVLRSCARAGPTTRTPIRSPTPSSTSASSASPARPPCSAAMRWPTCRAPGRRSWTAAAPSMNSQQFDFGTRAGATDSQGTAFARIPAGSPVQPRPELNGSGPGELSYITYEVTDSTAFKAFYSRVLYWTFEPGPHRRRLGSSADPPDGRRRGRQHRTGDRADVDRRGRRRRGGPGARGRRDGHRRAVAAAVREDRRSAPTTRARASTSASSSAICATGILGEDELCERLKGWTRKDAALTDTFSIEQGGVDARARDCSSARC